MCVLFYRVCEPYGCFSNFSPHAIWLQGKLWPTSEHYYQAQKFVGTSQEELCEKIRQTPTPEQAAAIGRNPLYPVRHDWEAVKCQVMYEAVLTKFQSYADLQQTLLGTGDRLIVENSPIDAFWGCGADGCGKNHLGQVLMQVRQFLRDHSA